MSSLGAAFVCAFIASCGGGGAGESTASVAQTPTGAPTQATALSAGTALTTTTNAAAMSAPAAPAADPAATALVVRARGTLAGGRGPVMQVRVGGQTVYEAEVLSTTYTDHRIGIPPVPTGSVVDIVFTNDALINGEDRNLYVAYATQGNTVVLPSAPFVRFDRGTGNKAFDGVDVVAGQDSMAWSGALRITWPAAPAVDVTAITQRNEASRFLQQASFGPTSAEVERVVSIGAAAWLKQQMALPFTPDYVNHVQAKFNLGADWRPGGKNYSQIWVAERFWAKAANGPDQLRRRVGWALHQMLMVSQTNSDLWNHSRAYGNYLDTLNQHAFRNYRTLLEEVALSPVMGIYLSHMRNRKEDPAATRLPDENFARELMQLFSIGLVELNIDGTPKLDTSGRPIETYTNADVMAMAKVFTGWSWALPDNQLTDNNFRWGSPDYSAANDRRIDLLKMKAYPGQHSPAEKSLFAGKPQAVTIPANGTAAASLRIALDTLFNHPNVGPFVSRQLIQRLVTSQPSPAYVARVAAVFNNNGKRVRGDMAAVVRAILLDAEARNTATPPDFGKLVEPVLRVSQWMRAFGVTSATGEFMMAYELDSLSQMPLYANSVFSYFRPGYVPPNTGFAARGANAPEFQIVNESTAATWVNLAEAMTGSGLGWTGSARDVGSNYAALAALSSSGNVAGMLDQLNLLLFAGRMTAPLRQALLDAVVGVSGNDSASHLYRARVAVFLALASPEYIVQR